MTAGNACAGGFDAEPEEDLAETGGGSTAPYLVAGAIALLTAGGGAVALARRRG
ncbi:LAETG motif-containing sortase-dependent surface protein [Streptomyces sp. NPDC050698]